MLTTRQHWRHVITNWPGLGGGKVSPKVPTVMLYNDSTHFKWGFEVEPLASGRIEAFKLLLDPDLPKPLYISAMGVQTELNRLKKTAVEVTGDFMKSLYQWALTHIEDRHLADYLKIVAVKFVVSMPAAWPEKARHATLQVSADFTLELREANQFTLPKAARDGGIDPIVQIDEPKAAAFFTLQSAVGESAGLQVGDAVTVCDAGGGTVDLISYKIQKLSPLEIVKLVPGTSRPAGSLMLNKKFEDYLKSVIDEEEFFSLRKTQSLKSAMMKFDEEIKQAFVCSNKRTYFVDFPGAHLTNQPDLNLRSNRITLTIDNLIRIFQPVVTDVNEAISAQISSARTNFPETNKVIPHCDHGALEYFSEMKSAKVDIGRGALLWHTPVKTADLFISGSIPNWYSGLVRASRHYGIACSSIWDPTHHASEEKHWDAWESVWRCTTTTWCIKKVAPNLRPISTSRLELLDTWLKAMQGDSLSGQRRIALRFYKQCPAYPDHDNFAITATLNESFSTNKPTSSSDGKISIAAYLTSNYANGSS
ncbi:MAG: hypothetical protein Q9214_003148 [Letrouitia sp. 1 TL-2023]